MRRKVRAAIKWIGAVVTVLLLVVWVGSAWYCFGFSNRTTKLVPIYVSAGSLGIAWDSRWSFEQLTGSDLFFQEQAWSKFQWWMGYDTAKFTRFHHIKIPLWFLAMLTGVPTLLLWRGDRRRRRAERVNLCPKCGYSRTGLPADHACPECGSVTNH